MNQKTKGFLSVMVPVVVWGISFVSTEYLLDALGPMTIGGIRFIFATAMMYGLMRLHKQPMAIERKDRALFLLAGGVGIAIYFLFENLGIKYISASPAALIIAAIPVFTLIFEAIFFKRRIDGIDVGVISLSIIGVIFIVDIKWQELFSAEEAIGYVLMFGAVIAWVVYSMASKPLFKRYSYLTIIYYQFLYSLPFFIVMMPFESNDWSALGLHGVGHLFFLGVFASVLGFYYYAKAMDLLGVTEASVYINFLPVVTILFSYVYMGHWIRPMQLLGGAIVLLSVTLTTLREKKRVAVDLV